MHRPLIFCLILYVAGAAYGHGGVVEEDDVCLMKVDYLRAHFKIYQPRISGHEQFCEDLPAATESIFVMEYEHESLSSMPIDFRIIRDVTGKGRFARMQDVEQIDDLDAVTVFYQAPGVQPDVFTVLHQFDDEGDFIGIVSARHPDSGQVYASVFPFEVGFAGFGYWPFIVLLLVLAQLQYLAMSGRLKRWFGRSVTLSVLLLLAMPVMATELQLAWSAPDGGVRLNKMHHWILHLKTAEGVPVEGARILVSGGMPEHDHGLPTAPRVTAELGEGRYRLDGMRFHMRGRWELVFDIRTDQGRSTLTIQLQL